MADIAPREQQPDSIFIREYVQAGIDKFETARRIERNLEGVAEKAANDPAVRDHDNSLSGMLVRQLRQKRHIAIDLLPHALAARDDIVRAQGPEHAPLLRKAAQDFVGIEALENPQMALAQPRIGDDVVPGQIGNGHRGLHGTAEITAVKRGKALARQPLRLSLRLRHAARGEAAVEMALPYTGDVPFGLAVADHNQMRTPHNVSGTTVSLTGR